MFRVTIMGRDLKEFQENLRDYANVHAGITEQQEVKLPSKAAVKKALEVVVDNEEYEEVESPYTTPSATPSTPAVHTNTVDTGEVDSENLPWDSRIHSSGKAFNANGTWRTRRNLDPAILSQVKAELRSQVRPVAMTAPQAAPVPMATIQSAPVAQAPVMQTPVVTQAAPTPAAPMPTMQTNGHTLDTFRANFPMVLAALINEKKVSQEYINQLNVHFNVPELWMINDEQKAQLFEQWVSYKFVQRVG